LTVKLLAIDTATEQCSVALLVGESCIDRCVQTARGHADLVLPMVQELLAEAGLNIAQLDAIAFGRGPGAFTGVRIAIGVAQGLAYAVERPLLPISDLAAVAQQGATELATGARILVCMDARMGEVYAGEFAVAADGLVMPVAAERVCAPEQVQVPAAELTMALGTGLRAYPPLGTRYVQLKLIDEALPRATEVAQLALRDWHAGLAVSPELAAPVYLRDRVAHVKTS
jgi:tRNA threonylcarbamoyladenosine biosynthesis protein TsaB